MDEDVVTLEDLAMAIGNRIGLPEEEAKRDANFVMDIFGFDSRVIDNVLEPEDRQLFYILEEEGMLTTEREETTLYDGREWRTHYWLLKGDSIKVMSETERELRRKRNHLSEEEDVYKSLPEDMWSARRL